VLSATSSHLADGNTGPLAGLLGDHLPQNKTGKELLYDNVDRWLRELSDPDESGLAARGDDIPF